MISGSSRRLIDAAPPRKIVAAQTKSPPEGGQLKGVALSRQATVFDAATRRKRNRIGN